MSKSDKKGVTCFDKPTARAVGQDVEKLLEQFAADNNLKVSYRGGNFSDTSFTAKIEFAVIDSAGVAQSKEITSFKKSALLYGLKPDDLGKVFSDQGTTYRIAGLRTRARTYPIVVERISDGKKFAMGADFVKNHL